MELQLVSFNQAKLLKELGFPQNVKHDYTYASDGQFLSMLSQKALCIAPTLELVAKWLREKKDIDVLIGRYMHSKYYLSGIIASSKYGIIEDDDTEYPTYEEALSAGIYKAIEILKND